MKRFLILLVGALVATAPVFAQLKPIASVEGITEYPLSNGLKVLLFPDNSSQTITVNITYLVGSRHEGYGEKGMAHLLEHMVFKGTPKHPDIPKELTLHGARPNGTTWLDRTNYFETFNATEENLDWALDLESDRMLNSYIAKKDLDSEFSVVRNEFEMGENSPTGVLMDQVVDAAYLWHNYGSSTIGNRSDIERVPIENLKAFYKKFYRPDNAVLMITGKFDPEAVLKKVEAKFGPLKNPSEPLPVSYTEEPPQDGEKRVTVSRVGDLQIVSALFHTASGSDLDFSAMDLVSNILTDQPSGRLYKALVETQKASTVWSTMPFTKEPGYIYINVDVPSDKSADEAETILKQVLDGFAQNPITQEELDRAKARMAKQFDQILRNSSYLGMALSNYMGAGDWRLFFLHRDRMADMDLEKINGVVARYLVPSNRTMGRFIPTKEPVRVEIPHVDNVEGLVANYQGREDMGTGEAFDVAYDHIQSRLQTGKLSDGIEYGFIEKLNRGNTVNVRFTLRNGDLASLMDKGVVPGFTASMLDKGTSTRSRQQIQDELSNLKSSIYFGARNGTIYATVNSTEENLMPTLQLMADMLKNPVFADSELQNLKTKRLADMEEDKTDPRFLASRRLSEINDHFPKGHPLHTLTIDEETAAIKALDVQAVKDFYNGYYGLGKSTLVAIGTFKGQTVSDFMAKEFKGFVSEHQYAEIPDPYEGNVATNEKILTPDKKNAWTFGYLPIKMSTETEDYAALEIATTIMGGGFLNSRIADRLRQKDGVSYGAGGGLGADDNIKDQNSQLWIYAIYNPDNYDKVQQGFREELDRLIADGVTQEELDNAVNGWIQAQSVSRAKDNELAGAINNNLYYQRTMAFQKNTEDKVAKLTVADVNRAVKKYLKPLSQWTVVNAGDFK